MKNLITILCILFISSLIIIPVHAANLMADCSGSGCHGLNPQTMGCGNDARTGESKSFTGGYVEHRYSVECDAEWARASNQGSSIQYVAASIRYGGSNYDYSLSVSSQSRIGVGQTVYTAMLGPRTFSRVCGRVNPTVGPIPTPVPLWTDICSNVG